MQLEFEKQGLGCLETVKRETQTQEQTQEIRVSDGMPDIGNVIGAWGQVILRSKEWQGDGMTVSGGTMVWVQYLPEEGGEPCSVEGWLPFQMKWSFPEPVQDGTILTQCRLLSVDARSTSARKLILRTNVSVTAWAMRQKQWEIFTPTEVPDDVQLKTESYPMLLPAEAGEKAFAMEEIVNLPPSAPKLEKLICFSLQPELTEEKIMADKVVFRGNALLHILYSSDDGGAHAWDFNLPFTQYNELTGEYGEDAQVQLWPCVTALEVDREGEELTMKAGLVCQYRICHRPVVTVVEDAYSAFRNVTPIGQELTLPGILESRTQNLHPQLNCPVEAMRLVDTEFHPQSLSQQNSGENMKLDLSGQFQLLSYDMEGNLQMSAHRWEESLPVPVGEGASLEASWWPGGKTQGNLLPGSAQVSTGGMVFLETLTGRSIPMVTALELGQPQEPDPRRPSLVLHRHRGEDLWELAKTYGSTVAAIQEANPSREQPEEGVMLLIPVL